jgi:Flp pilus assembly protein TadG
MREVPARMARKTPRRRSGAAAVEFALCLPLLMILLLGLWEVGRLIQLQQILSNAAREGARIAAQGITINSKSTPTQIRVYSGTPGVQQTVVDYLNQAGVPMTTANTTVTFAYLTGDTTLTEPYQASKGQQFKVTVTIPVSTLRWSFATLLGLDTLSTSVVWTSLVDDPFTVDTTLPSWSGF